MNSTRLRRMISSMQNVFFENVQKQWADKCEERYVLFEHCAHHYNRQQHEDCISLLLGETLQLVGKRNGSTTSELKAARLNASVNVYLFTPFRLWEWEDGDGRRAARRCGCWWNIPAWAESVCWFSSRVRGAGCINKMTQWGRSFTLVNGNTNTRLRFCRGGRRNANKTQISSRCTSNNQ